MPTKEKNIISLVPQQCVWNLSTLIISPKVMVHKIRESSRSVEWRAIPIFTPSRVLICLTIGVKAEVPISIETN